MRAVSLPVSPVARNRKDSTPRRAGRLVRCGASIRLTSVVGQERRIGAARNISALPPRADVGADIVEPPLRATTGPEQVQQKSFGPDQLPANAFSMSCIKGCVSPAFWNSAKSSRMTASYDFSHYVLLTSVFEIKRTG